MSKTVTSLFGSESQASSVVRRLEESGLAHGKICHFTEGGSNRFWDGANDFGDGTSGAGSLSGSGSSSGTGSDRIVHFLTRNGVPTGDAQAFAEGVRRGHSLVAVRCDDDEVERVISILDGDETIDLDEHQNTWRSEGWNGDDAGLAGTGGPATSGLGAGLMGSGAMSGATGGMGGSADTSGRTDRMSTDRMSGDRMSGDRDQVIPVAEEELHVGKREVNRGRVRIHTHVEERPVQEQVSLREERVAVERRPVEGSMRSGTMSGDELFQDRTIEMEERSEEAVVSKEARVKEELVIRKDVEQRTETISDTVRSTKVEVEDERGNRITGTEGGTDRKR